MVNKFKIIVLILITTGFLYIFADDGSWSKSFTIDGGSIYSEIDNEDIELVKEILIFTGDYTKAVFQFKNRSDKALTVSCGFPVQYDIEAFFGGDSLEVEISHYAPDEKIPVLDYMNTLPMEYTDQDDYMFGLTTDIILNNDFNNSREFISKDQTPEDLKFNITQDGKNIDIENVLLERYAGEEGAKVTFHYKHNLYFEPGGISTVVVEYHQDLFHGGDGMGNNYLWKYVIGTGGTWKGPIGEFVLIKPSDWTGNIDGMDTILDDGNLTVYSATDFKPSRKLIYTLYLWGYQNAMEQYEYLDNELPELKKMWSEKSKTLFQSSHQVQQFITNITASSFLSDKLPVFTNTGVILKAGFSPVAAFDGLTETSWSENVKGDGIGEYIEFTLTEKVWGISINNGFTRLPVEDWLFDITWGEIPFEDKVRDDSKGIKDYFTQNNRVKIFNIVNLSGKILYTIDLENQRDSQIFPGIVLSPGTYRFVIEEVYPGTKWQDTCIGEITFLNLENNIRMIDITEDQFYMEALKGVLFK